MLPLLTKEKVLKAVDQLYIMKHLVSGATEGGFKSPFRNDKGAGCWLNWFKGILYYQDPKDTFRNGKDIIQLWSIEKGVTYKEALYGITKFNGGFKVVPVKKVPSYFGYGLRNWEDYDIAYWSKRLLTIKDLENGNPGIFPALYFEYYSKKAQGLIRAYSSSARPLYVYIWKNRAKGYCPSPKWFIGDANSEDYYYYKGDPSCIVITSGGKDAKVLNKANYTSFALNGETYLPTALPLDLLQSYPQVIVGLDNDSTGQAFTIKMCEFLITQGIKPYICMPDTKDWDEDIVKFKFLKDIKACAVLYSSKTKLG
jgi:hypothetical protein